MKERAYGVTFYTQKDRREIKWTVYVLAHNQNEAKEAARGLWHNKDNPHQRIRKWSRVLGMYITDHPHMFYIEAHRAVGELDENFPYNEFCVLDSRAVTWGYQK